VVEGGSSLVLRRLGASDEPLGKLSAGRHRLELDVDTVARSCEARVDDVITTTQCTSVNLASGTNKRYRAWYGLYAEPNGTQAGDYLYDNIAIHAR
jgi:hypothetical protein